METPASNGHEVVGISQAENKKFWEAKKRFNCRYNQITNWLVVMASIWFDIQLFLVSFDVEIVVYIVIQAFNILNGNVFIWSFLFSIYTLNVYFIECMLFLRKKIRHISQQVQQLRTSKTKLINNRRLARLISDFNRVNSELIEFNDFFKNFLGSNVLHFFGLAIFMAFIGAKRLFSQEFFHFCLSKRPPLLSCFS